MINYPRMYSSRCGNPKPSSVQSGNDKGCITGNELKWLQSVRIVVFGDYLGTGIIRKGIELSDGC